MGNNKSVPLSTSNEWEIVDWDPECILDGFYKVPKIWMLSQEISVGIPPLVDAGTPPSKNNVPEIPPPETSPLEDPVPETPPLEEPMPEIPPLEDPVPETPPLEEPMPETPPLEEPMPETPPPKDPVPETPPLPPSEDTLHRLPYFPVQRKPPSFKVPLTDDQPRLKPMPALKSVSDFVKRRVKENYVRVLDDICRLNLQHVASHLFQRSVISKYDLDYAANLYHDDRVKAQRLINVFFHQNLSPPLKVILLAFEEAGVETLIEIAGEAKLHYPEAFGSLTKRQEGKSSGQDATIMKQPSCVTAAEAICCSPEILVYGPRNEVLSSDQDKILELDEQVKTTIKELSAGEHGLNAAEEYIQTEIETEEGELLLHKACLNTIDLSTFNLVLLAAGKTLINFTDSRVCGRTPLHMACSQLPTYRDESKTSLQLSKITNLLKSKASTSPTDHDGNTPVHLAALRNSAEAVKLILTSNPVTINKTNNLGNTALHIACKYNYLDVARALFDHKVKATISNTTKKNRTPLQQALAHGHSMMAGMVLDYEPKSVNCVDKKNMSPLLLASKRGNVWLADRLVKKSHCQVDVVDNEGKTPLHYACVWGNYELVSLLLNGKGYRKIINHPDNNGDTALHIASYHRNKRLIHLLRSKHASKKIKNKLGQIPKDIRTSKICTLPYEKTTVPRSMSKPCLSYSQSCASLTSAISAQSFSSVCTTATSSYLDTSDEEEKDERIWNV